MWAHMNFKVRTSVQEMTQALLLAAVWHIFEHYNQISTHISAFYSYPAK